MHSFLERTEHLCTTHRHSGTRPCCTTSKHWDNICSWHWWESAHNQEISQTTVLPLLINYPKLIYKPLGQAETSQLAFGLPPEVASLLNKTPVSFPIKTYLLSTGLTNDGQLNLGFSNRKKKFDNFFHISQICFNLPIGKSFANIIYKKMF